MKDVHELRKLAGWTQYRLAMETGIERTKLSLIENRHVAPSVEEQATLEQVAGRNRSPQRAAERCSCRRFQPGSSRP